MDTGVIDNTADTGVPMGVVKYVHTVRSVKQKRSANCLHIPAISFLT